MFVCFGQWSRSNEEMVYIRSVLTLICEWFTLPPGGPVPHPSSSPNLPWLPWPPSPPQNAFLSSADFFPSHSDGTVHQLTNQVIRSSIKINKTLICWLLGYGTHNMFMFVLNIYAQLNNAVISQVWLHCLLTYSLAILYTCTLPKTAYVYAISLWCLSHETQTWRQQTNTLSQTKLLCPPKKNQQMVCDVD